MSLVRHYRLAKLPYHLFKVLAVNDHYAWEEHLPP